MLAFSTLFATSTLQRTTLHHLDQSLSRQVLLPLAGLAKKCALYFGDRVEHMPTVRISRKSRAKTQWPLTTTGTACTTLPTPTSSPLPLWQLRTSSTKFRLVWGHAPKHTRQTTTGHGRVLPPGRPGVELGALESSVQTQRRRRV